MNEARRVQTPPHVNVAIVGAGPAGLAAASAAVAQGASVAVIDSAEQPGGQFWRHRSEAAGVADDGAFHHGWGDYLRLRASFDEGVASGSIRYLPSTSVWFARQLTDSRFALELAPSHGASAAAIPSLRASKLVLATGGYDRQLPVPGWDLPGVMAAGGIQAFVKQNGMLPGSRFVIAGTGPFLLPVAANIVQAGGSVAAVCEAASLAGWIPRAHRAAGVPSKALEGVEYAAAFFRHRIHYRTRTVITEILGTDRVEAVRTARVNARGALVSGSSRLIEGIDGVGLGWGFTPQMELPVQLGVETRVDTDGSLVGVVDRVGRSSVPGLFLAGELTGVGGAVLAVLEGRIAGRAAGAEAVGSAAGTAAASVTTAERRSVTRQRAFADAMHRAHPVPEGWQDRVDEDTLVCRCEEVPAGALRRGNSELAAEDLRSQKGVTRAGMGWCQGRVCGFAVACMSASDPADSLRTSAKRPVAQPVPLAALRDLPEV